MSWVVRRSVGASTVVFALVVSACGSDKAPSAAGADAGKAGADAGNGGAKLDFTAFDAAVSKFVKDSGLEGASAVIVHRDRGVVHTKGYGTFDENRSYLVMSSSKIVSAGILLRLADQGKLDLDAPIGNYVSAWGSGKPQLTVAQLISGSSGLVGVVDNISYAPYACQSDASAALSACAKTIYTADDAADRKKPDTEFHYGGAPWQLAGGVAEVASGKPWAELVKETYVDPCGVSDTGYKNPALLSTFKIVDGGLDIGGVGYPATVHGDTSVVPDTQNPSIEGGLYTTVGDYGKILLMHLRGGLCDGKRVLSEASVAKMQADRIETYSGNTNAQMRIILASADPAVLKFALDFSGYGMGWWIDRAEAGVVIDPGAYGSDAWLDVKRGYGAFIAIESNVVVGAALLGAAKSAADAAFDAVAR